MDNLRGIALMIAAMAGFALEDLFIKNAAAYLPPGQILVVLGAGGAAIFALLARMRGERLIDPVLLSPIVMARNAGEALAAIGLVLALALTPLSTAAAILQATPLAVTLGGALFLGAAVGWRRWTAIGVGFLGVLLIVRPGMDGFMPASLFAVLAVAGLAMRDLATRALPDTVGTFQLSAWGFGVLVVSGVFLMAVMADAPVWHTAGHWHVGGAIVIGVLAYYAIVGASRIGEIAVVTPFRYTRLVFALAIGYVAFAERPDALTLAGAALIVATGLYTLVREARLSRSRAAANAAHAIIPPVSIAEKEPAK